MLTALSANDCARAGATLGRAFQDDPVWTAAFPEPDVRPDVLAAMFTGLAKATIAGGGFAETTPGIDAAALWLPPGRDLGVWAMVKSGFSLPRFVMRLSAADRKRLMAVLRQLDGRRKVLMPEPHWYLSAVGVDPGHQGEGLGTMLVRSGIEKAEEEGAPLYLETETEGNVGFYRRLGFQVVEQVVAKGLDVPVWMMLRRPS